MSTNSFTFEMQDSPFEVGEIVTKQLIEDALDYIFEDYTLGNFNFFLLSHQDSFIQAIFENGYWHIELCLTDGIILTKNSIKDSEVYCLFYNFFNSNMIDTSSFCIDEINETYLQENKFL